MKIGTAPKITVGVIAIVALAFLGSRQLLSPKEDFSLSSTVTVPRSSTPEPTSTEVGAPLGSTATVPQRADEPQISAEEMGQTEDFFAQLEASNAQSKTVQLAEAEFQQDDDKRGADNTDTLTENSEQSAEEVMNAYAEAFKNSDFEGMRSLETAALRERWNSSDPNGFTLEAEVIRRESEFGTEVVEDPDVVEEARLQLERLMFEPVLEMTTQATIVDSGYFGDEFHFRLGMPAPEMPAPSKEAVIETEIPPPPDTLVKMRKENGMWRIYESHTLN